MTTAVRWTGPLEALSTDDRTELVARAQPVDREVRQKVASMAERIRAQGDDALVTLTRRFDEVELEELRVPEDVLEDALASAPKPFVESLELAIDQIRAYHETLRETETEAFQRRGIEARERRVPLARVGIYVPGGRAAYPSTVAMTVVPAQVAGVEEIVLATPPGPDGRPHDLVLAACHLLDIDHVVPVGGAQAILALAQGTETVPACQAVAGPGNVYVQAAKEHVAGSVRIDAPAGPSEIAVLAGPEADPHVIARELVAQAEHDPAALAVYLGLDEAHTQAVHEAIDDELAELPRAPIVREALEARGALLTARDLEQAEAFLDELAPEHCLIAHPDGPEIADRLTGPACIVTGRHGRVPLTDYVAGPSHVLPTGGHARSHSGIDVDTFTKRIHVAHIDEPDPELVEAGAQLARLESLEGHARALDPGTEEDP